MSYDETLASRIRAALGERTDVVEKQMFGALCFMVGGAMCCGLTKTDFMVRVGPDQYDDALAQLRVPTGPADRSEPTRGLSPA